MSNKMGNVLSKFQDSNEIEFKKLFDSVPTKYKKIWGEVGGTEGNLNEIVIDVKGLNWMLNNTSNRKLRQRIMTLMQEALMESSD